MRPAQIGLVVAGGAIVAASMLFGLVSTEDGLRIAAGATTALGCWWLLSQPEVRRPRASEFDRAVAVTPMSVEARPPDLVEMEGIVRLQITAADLHFRLRPVLRSVATHRLLVHRGVELDRDPVAAR